MKGRLFFYHENRASVILIPNKKFPKNLRQNLGFTIFTQILVLSLFGIRITIYNLN
jgi:hypothetical protein